MCDTQALPGTVPQKSSGCGCGGREEAGCGCGCEATQPKPCSFDLGQRYSLDSAADGSTATDPFPLAGGSAIEICATVFAQAGAASLDLVLLGTLDGDNFETVDTQTFTSGVGYHSWSVTGLVWREVRIGARAHSGSVPVVFSLYAYTSCAG